MPRRARVQLLTFFLLSSTAPALAACGNEGAPGDHQSPLASSKATTQDRQIASEHVRAVTGLSHIPRPESNEALAASLRRHYPPALKEREVGGDVLVDVRLDARGSVEDVAVVRSAAPSGDAHQVVLLEKVPGSDLTVEREGTPRYDAAFGPAAQAALREVRFLPALRDGKPVPYTLRMTVSFQPPRDTR